MKKSKQICSLALVLLLVFFMFGCDTVSVPTNPTTVGNHSTSQTTVEQTTTEPSGSKPTSSILGSGYVYPPIDLNPDSPASDEKMNITCQCIPKTVENPDNLPVLKWVCLVDRTIQTWTEDAVQEANQMLSNKDIPFRVQFVILSTDQSYLHSDWLSRTVVKEALEDADLVFGWLTPAERKACLLPITEYVIGDAQPSLKNAVLHELSWIGASVDGEIYGIQTYPLQSSSTGWQVESKLLKEYGLSAEDFKKNFWEMDEIFEKIYSKNGNKPFLLGEDEGYQRKHRNSVSLTSIVPNGVNMAGDIYQLIGACFAIDHHGENSVVVNTLETESVRNTWAAIMRYKNAGYVTMDPDISQVRYGSLHGDVVYTNSDEKICIPVTSSVYNSLYVGQDICGVAAASRHVEEAIMLLNLVAEDEAFQKQLFFGKEGRDFTLTNGVYAPVRQEKGDYYNMEFLSVYSYFSHVMENRNDWLAAHEGKTTLQTYKDNLDSVSIRYCPIIFDYTDFEQEIDEMEKIFNIYFHFYTNNTEIGEPGDSDYVPRMTEELYNQMLQELKDAGSDMIIAELQRQLDAWLEEHPDWQ